MAHALERWTDCDAWTLREALLLLAGLEPDGTQWGAADGMPDAFPAGRLMFLDGKPEDGHPEWAQAIADMAALTQYARNTTTKLRTPADWLTWAASKGFTPRWSSRASAEDLRKLNLHELNPTGVVHSTKGERSDALTDEIERAVRETGSTNTATVFNFLTERALHEQGPFDGVADGDALMYTDGGTAKTITKKNIGKRLARLPKAR